MVHFDFPPPPAPQNYHKQCFIKAFGMQKFWGNKMHLKWPRESGWKKLTCVASVSLWFRSKERPRNATSSPEQFSLALEKGTRLRGTMDEERDFRLRGVCHSFLVLCSETSRKRLLGRLLKDRHSRTILGRTTRTNSSEGKADLVEDQEQLVK